MLPKYKEVEERDVHLIPNHKEYFDETVEAMKKKYNFTHLNFKNLDIISDNRNCYFDAEHLNIYGAYKFTKILNDIISESHE